MRTSAHPTSKGIVSVVGIFWTPYGPYNAIRQVDKALDPNLVYCRRGPVTDLHIKSGIHGAMIAYPRNETLRPAKGRSLSWRTRFTGPANEKGFIPGTDPAKTQKNDQTFSMFNGRLDNEAVRVNPGDLVRMYFVKVGPWVSAAHVIGTVLDRVYDGKAPVNGVQTYGIPPGSGAILEFYIPEPGCIHSSITTSWHISHTGWQLAFANEGVPAAAH